MRDRRADRRHPPCLRAADILAYDRSDGFVSHAQAAVVGPRVRFETANAMALPAGDGCIDVVAAALVMNFIPDCAAALGEMRRILRPGGRRASMPGTVPGGKGFIDVFRAVAERIDPGGGTERKPTAPLLHCWRNFVGRPGYPVR